MCASQPTRGSGRLLALGHKIQMTKLLNLLALTLGVLSASAASMTASDEIWGSSVTFQTAPGALTYYIWIPSTGSHSVRGKTYTGPGWVTAYNTKGKQTFSSGYTIQIAPNALLWSSVIWDMQNQSASFSCPTDLVAHWESLGGSIAGTIEGDCE
jgi:hypothetical protein